MRVRYAGPVAAFLDQAEAAGVRNVTLLSTYNGDRAPREIDIAAVAADLASREAFTHSILRPAWVMQNFIDDHLPAINGTLAVPSGGGSEAFVDAADIAAVTVETLLNPTHTQTLDMRSLGPRRYLQQGRRDHRRRQRPARRIPGHRPGGLDQRGDHGRSADGYASMLRWLTGAIIAGDRSRPTGDIETVVGRPPTSFEAFAGRNTAAWTTPEDK